MAEVSIETKHQRYRRKHPERIRERLYAWRKANPEKINEIVRRSYQKHKDEINERIRADRKESPEKYREYEQKHYHRGGCARRRKYYQRHRESCIMAITNRRILKRTSGVEITVEQWRDICERFNNRCAYCGIHQDILWIIYNQNLTMDHVIPLSRDGEHSVENIVPACPECNDKKGAKLWPK